MNNNSPPNDRPRMRRSVLIALIGIPVLIASIGFGGGAWLWMSLTRQPEGAEVAGLSAPLIIRRDKAGIPYIRTDTSEDAYFALGYVHAQDRFWQMEAMRRYGAGRLSEVMGEATIGSDKWMRTLGLYRLAEMQVDDLGDHVRKALLAYARGVNAWLGQKSDPLTLELALLRYTPEPWKIADSLVWGKIMATQLAGNFRTEILRSLIAKRIPASRVGELWPAYPADAPVSINGVEKDNIQSLLGGLAALPPWPEGLPAGASNFWAVDRKNSSGGGALLANDPHLGFGAPVMWYLARIETPTMQVSGATVPGVPFHILGHNKSIAWGITSTQADMEDLFIESLSPDDPASYLTPDGKQVFDVRKEVIRVKGAPDQVLEVRESRHGPIISDIRDDLKSLTGNKYVVALSATYLETDDQTSSAFFYLNRASNWSAFTEALQQVQGPVLNFAYGDVDGNIGFMTPGLVPVRGAGSGVVPSPGWTGETDWQGFIPYEDLPRLFNPSEGKIVNANNRIVGPDYPNFISHDWAARYRAERIEEVLDAARGKIDLALMMALQNDNVSLMARDLLERLLPLVKPERDDDKAAIALLRKWDGAMARERAEPLIFSTWVLELNKAIYGDELGNLTPGYLKLRPRFLISVLTRRNHWCDDSNTPDPEDCASRVNIALSRAMDSLKAQFGGDPGSLKWGDVHKATFNHPVLTNVPLLNRLADLSIASDGGDYTVNRGATRPNNEAAPFAHIHGPGFRAIYDLSDLSKSRFMIATGQSGNPLSAHYSDLLGKWRDGQYLGFASRERGALGKATQSMFTLLPLVKTQ